MSILSRIAIHDASTTYWSEKLTQPGEARPIKPFKTHLFSAFCADDCKQVQLS